MPIRRHAGAVIALLALPAAAAHALPPPASLVAGALPRGGMMAAAVLRAAHRQTQSGLHAPPLPVVRAEAVTPAGPRRERPGLLGGRDLDDVVAEKLGGRVSYYFGRNLAKGDASGVKTFGLKFFFK